MPGSSYDMALSGGKGNTKINAILGKKSYCNYFCTLDGSPESQGWPLPIHIPMTMAKAFLAQQPLFLYMREGRFPPSHSFPSQVCNSNTFSNSHGKPGKIFTALSKHRMTTGLLDIYSSSWWFIRPMAPLGAMLLEKSSWVKLSSFPPPRESASEQQVSEKAIILRVLQGSRFWTCSACFGRMKVTLGPCSLREFWEPISPCQVRAMALESGLGSLWQHCLTLQGILNLWPGRRCGY